MQVADQSAETQGVLSLIFEEFDTIDRAYFINRICSKQCSWVLSDQLIRNKFHNCFSNEKLLDMVDCQANVNYTDDEDDRDDIENEDIDMEETG